MSKPKTPIRTESGEKLYKLAELETLLSASRKTIKRWIYAGKLDAEKLGAGPNAPWRVSASAIRRFREQHGRTQ